MHLRLGMSGEKGEEKCWTCSDYQMERFLRLKFDVHIYIFLPEHYYLER
jgi:hypothetical protein